MIINPKKNLELIGYNKIFLELKNLYDKNILPNKIIFSGNGGIGKSTLVYHLINYIFSFFEENKYDFNNNLILNNNRSYNLILNNTHPNFFLISADDEKKNIQISKIRDMISFTNKSSFNNDYKIILIDNVEYLNINSVNALLKIIEEPNNKIFFFLIHDCKKKLLDTLKSRCIKFNFNLNKEDKLRVVNKFTSDDFYDHLNDDFKNHYNSPRSLIYLYNFLNTNNLDLSISIDNVLKLIIDKKFYKKDLFIKENLSYFIELYFNKKLIKYQSKNTVYNLYKYFLSKINDCDKYNLDLESILLEFNGRLLND
tara:strand:- start:3394 stop:4329 length:936 start_codon:yes stop_codon:yes gene_type:complete